MKAIAEILISPQQAYDIARAMRNKPPKPLTDATWTRFLHSEHSPIRVATYKITITDLSYYSAMHFRTHHIGVEHFITSNRPDIANKARSVDDTVTHIMVANAQALITISRKRMCNNASMDTRDAMDAIGLAIWDVDSCLARCMRPDCMYRGKCNEMEPCMNGRGEMVESRKEVVG